MRGGILDTIKMQCLQVNISDRNIYATNGFYSAPFSSGHVGNRDTKVFIYSCNIPHFTMRRTQAKKHHFNTLLHTILQSQFYVTIIYFHIPLGDMTGNAASTSPPPTFA